MMFRNQSVPLTLTTPIRSLSHLSPPLQQLHLQQLNLILIQLKLKLILIQLKLILMIKLILTIKLKLLQKALEDAGDHAGDPRNMRSPDAEDREQSRDVEARASPEEDLLNIPGRSRVGRRRGRVSRRRGRVSRRRGRVEDVTPKKIDGTRDSDPDQ